MTTIIKDRLKALDSITLQRGAHDSNKQMCAMEAAAWIAGEEHSDRPRCVSPVLGAFVRSWNDALDDEERQALKPCIPRMIGTAGDGHDEERARMAADWLVRVCTPAWLDLGGINDSAQALRSLPPITGATLTEGKHRVEAAREKAAAAWHAARAAAGDAARAAATAAAGAAAWAAVRDAVRDAAGDVAWTSVRDAIWAAAWDVAWDAVGAAAWDVAWDAARAAAWDAARAAAGDAAAEAKEQGGNYRAQYDAAYEAARAKLDSEPLRERFEPVKVELQRSALELLDRMIDGPFGEHA